MKVQMVGRETQDKRALRREGDVSAWSPECLPVLAKRICAPLQTVLG